MTLLAHPAISKVRRLTRRVGLNGLFGRFLGIAGYETRLQNAMRNVIHPGDCVWDVGANVGWYTLQFANWVGEKGYVFAFEPEPKNLHRLDAATHTYNNISILPIGLSSAEGHASFLTGDDKLGATSMIVSDTSAARSRLTTIALTSGDAAVANGLARPPKTVKIDVEGHKLEVVQGMAKMLAYTNLNNIFIEIHFELLEHLGSNNAPALIEGILKRSGFKLKWVDPSHLHAYR